MNPSLRLFLGCLLVIAFATTGCASGDRESTSDDAAGSVSSPAPATAASAAPVTAEPETTFEPAYPADVAEEGLTDDDVAQQEITHSHGDEGEHSHGEGEHSHGEGEHSHGDG